MTGVTRNIVISTISVKIKNRVNMTGIPAGAIKSATNMSGTEMTESIPLIASAEIKKTRKSVKPGRSSANLLRSNKRGNIVAMPLIAGFSQWRQECMAVRIAMAAAEIQVGLFNKSVHTDRVPVLVNRGQKTTPTFRAHNCCGSGLLTANCTDFLRSNKYSCFRGIAVFYRRRVHGRFLAVRSWRPRSGRAVSPLFCRTQ